jgi:hypothetical protein
MLLRISVSLLMPATPAIGRVRDASSTRRCHHWDPISTANTLPITTAIMDIFVSVFSRDDAEQRSRITTPASTPLQYPLPHSFICCLRIRWFAFSTHNHLNSSESYHFHLLGEFYHSTIRVMSLMFGTSSNLTTSSLLPMLSYCAVRNGK